jgi:arabinose-5-phosphate isomerase
MTDARRIAERVLRLEGDAVLGLIAKLDARFDQAVELLRRCAGRVIVTGMGKSGLIGRKIAATFASTGTPAYFLHPAEGAHGDIGMVARGDVVLALSNSGETDEVLAVVPPLKRLGVPIIVLTGSPRSTLAQQCDVVIDVSVAEEACPMNLAPTSSTTATLAMGDALAMALLERRGLGPEDYAALHPRGTLGFRTLVRVSDLLHTGDAMPVVSADAPLSDVIVAMSAKRTCHYGAHALGMTMVVDGAGLLIGVFTDGDLRRLHLGGRPLTDLSAAQVATREPKLIAAGDLAAKALEVMEAFQVTSLVVVDADDGAPGVSGKSAVATPFGRPLGVIHIQDILRAKVSF